MKSKKLYRSSKDVKIAGIIGGIAEMLRIDATILRLAVVFLAVVTGIFPAVITYIVGWFIIPEELKEEK